MQSITLEDFQQNFDYWIDQVADHKVTLLVTLEDGDGIVVLPVDEYNDLMEQLKTTEGDRQMLMEGGEPDLIPDRPRS